MQDAINAQLRSICSGRKWILAFDAAAGTGPLVDVLKRWGADDVLIVAGSRGAGDLPADVQVVEVDAPPSDSIMSFFRGFVRAVAEPDDATAAAVDAFDPAAEAKVVMPPWADIERALGRRVFGPRRPEWTALEDKMVADELWEAAGIAHVRSVRCSLDAAPAAAREVEGPLGSVWAADNSEGWHGGGNSTRWVLPTASQPGHAAEMVGWFRERARRVRVMPFLDGIPCSIHGYVTEAQVAAFRPVEMVILRRTDEPRFVYGGTASFWDPPEADRAEMRAAARLVGDALRARAGYRGPFSIDGVMTTDGFRPTELNPRLSGGLGLLASAVEDLPLGMLTRAYVDGTVEVDANWLETYVVSAADGARHGRLALSTAGSPPDPETVFVRSGDNGVVPCDDESEADATVSVGASLSGVFARVLIHPGAVGEGSSVAPLAIHITEFVRTRWGVDMPPLAPAPDVRSG